jgi:hypothetical protein
MAWMIGHHGKRCRNRRNPAKSAFLSIRRRIEAGVGVS